MAATHSPKHHTDTPTPIVAVVGGGVGGLVLAATLRTLQQRATQSADTSYASSQGLRVFVFDARPVLSHTHTQWTIWKWALPALVDLGLGALVARCGAPLAARATNDLTSRKLVVSYPPIDPTTQLPEPWVPNAPPLVVPATSGTIAADDDIAARFAVCSIDRFVLIEALLYILKHGSPPPLEFDPTRPDYVPIDQTDIPELRLGHDLESYLISANSGTVTAHFHNGISVVANMLVGCDGARSVVRESLCGQVHADVRALQDSSSGIIFSGLSQLPGSAAMMSSTRGNNPIRVIKTSIVREEMIQNQQRALNELRSFLPRATVVAHVGRDVAVGVTDTTGRTSVTDGIVAWTIVLSQGHVTRIERLLKARCKQLLAQSERLYAAPQLDTTSDKIQKTASIAVDGSNDTGSNVSFGDLGLDAPSRARIGATKLTIDTGSSNRDDNLSNGIYDFLDDPQVDILSSGDAILPSEIIHATLLDILCEEVQSSTNGGSSSDPPTMPNSTAAQVPLPIPLLNLIKTSRIDTVNVERILSIIERPSSLTSPKFHPGRVVILGDAAHCMPISATFSRGGNMAMMDANILAKLIYLHNPDLQQDEEKFKKLGLEFSKSRLAAAKVVLQQKMEQEEAVSGDVYAVSSSTSTAQGSVFGKQSEGSILNSLWRWSWKMTPNMYVRERTKSLLTDGGLTEKEEIIFSKMLY